METLYRLGWALPLVLAVGVAAVLVLKRYGPAVRLGGPEALRMRVRESLALSQHTCVHWIEVDRQAFLVLESQRHATLQAMPARIKGGAR